ncbi:peptidase M16 [Taibaiella sp. KBW10]|uniref:M16 family metallopeptidase n=1 Tax=Taibaiella sp. KBW10 TaxID=2153357 RepID=UPI000F5B5A1D|nr:M16 family metallopeptidase [Taibaiella sp. KBW10]RQO29802.1 peptidase M16 [Taibaiella sp. KBW10]
MNFIKNVTAAALIVVGSFQFSFAQDSKYQWKENTEGGYTYKYVTNDPSGARFYTLKNGLTVILSPNKKKPRIQTYIATKAGSKTDPSDHTGLAHYLEHMLFKGTDKFGSLDWAKEKPLLDQIDALYAQYNETTDEAKRKEIYKEIDRMSGEASKYAIPNEYDKMMAAMGAEGTNAFTSFEQTVYVEDIPSNAVDKYLAVQAERFRNPILRLFHTELEAVYEEKNRGLDEDSRKSIETMFAALFPNNNYGKQTTIGTIEHLRNPSLKAIREYYTTYYVPNNMGVIMSGDFDANTVIKKIDQAFAYMKPKAVPAYVYGKETEIKAPIVKEVLGPKPENVMIGFRFPGAATKDAQMLELVGNILTNGSAGLIDLDLVKSQKLLSAYAFPYILKDYSMLILQGNPTQGQSLDEVRSLLLAELAKLRNGDFSDDLIQSIVNNEKKNDISQNEEYSSRANNLMDNFTSELDWSTTISYPDVISKITKQDIVNFAKKYLNDDNYVIVYKRKGEDKSIVKVEKPPITPITLNKDVSPFVKQVNALAETPIAPLWVNYTTDIKKGNVGPAELLSVQNKDNSLFRMYYHYDMGKWNNKLLPVAAGYLEYLGTKDKSTEEFSKQFYKLASSFNVSTANEETYITLDGLNENFEASVALLENLLKNCEVDEEALTAYKAKLKKSRANAKENKSAIMAGLRSYAQYGAQNPFNNVLSDQELDKLTAKQLVDILHQMVNYKHRVLYYGPKSVAQLQTSLKPLHIVPAQFTAMPAAASFTAVNTTQNQVLFANYDMKQAEVFWFRNSEKYNVAEAPTVSLFNNYFGGGMGSVVFQTIRESKALAYSTYAYFGLPSKKENRSIVGAYVGTQADKIKEAVVGMNELLNVLPESENALSNAKLSLAKSLASERITQDGIIFSYLAAKKLGNTTDIRKNVYEQAPKLTFTNLKAFHTKEMSKKPYVYCIVGNESSLKESELAQYGTFKKLTLEEIFGY